MGKIKQFDGFSWGDINPKKFDGYSWLNAQAFERTSVNFEEISAFTKTATWNALFTRTYNENGTKRVDSKGQKLCQGKYDSAGVMRSLCGFDNGSIRSELAGAKIKQVQLYLKAEHWYYTTGGIAYIGYHNHSSEPSAFSHSVYDAKRQSFDSRGQAIWIDLPVEFGEGIRDGIYKGISIFANRTDQSFYGIFSGMGGVDAPKLKITYEN